VINHITVIILLTIFLNQVNIY